jgi:NADH dehydrogenase
LAIKVRAFGGKIPMTSIVTVFGGSGFVGRHTVQALARAGHRIRVAVRRPNVAQYLPPMGTVGQIQVVKCNVLDETSVARAVQGTDAIVNLVGVLNPFGSQRFESIHAEAAETVAKAAMTGGAGVMVHMSALGAEIESPSSYAKSKAEGELNVRKAFPAATILRPSIVFGPEDHFFNRFASMARFSPFLPLIGGGHTKFQPVFVCDVADAIVHAVSNSKHARARTFELGGPTVYSFRELMELLLRTIARKRVLFPIPFPVASLLGAIGGLSPWAPLTMDQVRLLKSDNVVSKGALTLEDMDIYPDSVEAVIPSYLWRFRARGQFENSSSERAIGAPATR